MINYTKNDSETFNTYLLRIGKEKTKHETWDIIATNINSKLGLNFSESYYRKRYKQLSEQLKSKYDSQDVGASTAEDVILELKKQKMKMSEERVLANAYLRRISREETLRDIASELASEMNLKKILPTTSNIKDDKSVNKAVLELSDWHYGICVDHAWNKYNPEICVERVAKLRDKVLEYCEIWGIKELHVLNLSDLIAGRIHLQLRLDSRYDVMTQTMNVAEILAELLNDLSAKVNVHYYDCLDNHSRIEPNKADNWNLESLVRIIPWYLKERLANSNIVFHSNEFGLDIITLRVFDHEILGVHGDCDSLSKIIENMTLMTKRHYDLICAAHLHHFSSDERNETLIVSNSSLMGTDNFAKQLRLSSKPSQNLIIMDRDNPIKAIHRILL